MFIIKSLLLLILLQTSYQQLTQGNILNMAGSISTVFNIYMNNFTGHDQLQKIFDNAIVTIQEIDGSVKVSSIATEINSVLNRYNTILFKMREELLANRSQRNNDDQWSSTLKNSWKKLYSQSDLFDLKSLYFGGSSGLVKTFPETKISRYLDSRELPWFQGAATPQKDIVLLLDASSSMGQNYWLEAVSGSVSIINALTPDDFFQIIITSDKRVIRFNCGTPYGLIRGTLDNKLEAIKWLQSLRPSGKANVEELVYELYDIFFEAIGSNENIGLLSNTSNCLKFALIVGSSKEFINTDIEGIISEIGNELPVIIHSWIVGPAVNEAREHSDKDFHRSYGGTYEASCSHDGIFNIIDGKDLHDSMLESYRYIAAGYTRTDPLWIVTYNNRTKEVLLSGVLPIYSPDSNYPEIWGVIGVDITYQMILDILEKEQIGLSYAFLVSKFGEVLSHPRAPDLWLPVDLKGPLFYDISLVETSFQNITIAGDQSQSKTVRELLVEEKSGNATFIINLPIPRGDTGEGFVLQEAKMHFFWHHVDGSPFIVVLALNEENLRKRIMDTPAPIAPSAFQNEHLMLETNQTSFLPPGFVFTVTEELLSHNISGASFTHSSISGTYHTGLSGDWESFFERIRLGDLELTRRAMVYFNDLSITPEMLAETTLSKKELMTNPIFGREIKEMIQLTAKMDEFWRFMEILAFIDPYFAQLRYCLFWSVIGTDPGGLLRTWPGFPQSYHDVNPYSHTWFQRALSNIGVFSLSQPFRSLGQNDIDTDNIGRVITLSKAIYYNSEEKEAGIVGAISSYFDYGRFYNVTLLAVGCPTRRENRGGLQCVILDRAGSLLMIPEFTTMDRFTFLDNSHKTPNSLLAIGDREPELAQQLLDMKFLKINEQINYKTRQIEFSFIVDEDVLLSSPNSIISGQLNINPTLGYCTTANYYITPIKDSNTFLVIFEGYYFSEDNCTIVEPSRPISLEFDTCQVNSQYYPRPQPSCPIFRVTDEVLEDVLRSTKCDQDDNPELVWIEWSDLEAIIVSSITAFVALLTLITLGVTFYHRESPIMKASSPLFMYIILLGSLLAYPVVILSIGKPNSVNCNFKLWLGVIAFILIFGSLSIKTFRIWRIFYNLRFLKAARMEDIDLLKRIGILCIFPILVLIIWMIVSPLEAIAYDDNVDEEKETLRCGNDDDLIAIVFGGLLAGYAVLMMIVAGLLAFKVRNAVKAFNESRLIAISIYNFTLLSTIGIVLSIILRGTPTAAFLIFTIGIILAVFGVVLILFIPKIYIIMWRPDLNIIKTHSFEKKPNQDFKTTVTDVRTSTVVTSASYATTSD